jgi:hypothetical protein
MALVLHLIGHVCIAAQSSPSSALLHTCTARSCPLHRTCTSSKVLTTPSHRIANANGCQLLCCLSHNSCLRARLQIRTTAVIAVACDAAASLVILPLLHKLV